MRLLAVVASVVAVYAITSRRRLVPLVDRLADYLAPAPPPEPGAKETSADVSLKKAGLVWSTREWRLRRSAAGLVGVFAGLLLAQGDLFVAGPERSAPGLGLLGGAAGLLAMRTWLGSRTDRRARALRSELPTVCDIIALHLLAGESVPAAVASFVGDARGVAADELRAVMSSYAGGDDLGDALMVAAATTSEVSAARLYRLLAQTHATGGSAAGALGDLAGDYRAFLAREITTEGGRRSVATYGPILALMVPVTLMFLMYPTLLGLREIAGTP